MSLHAIEDYVSELRATNSVLESYAQLATRCDEQNATSIQQVGNFMFLVYQQQLTLLTKIEQALRKAS